MSGVELEQLQQSLDRLAATPTADLRRLSGKLDALLGDAEDTESRELAIARRRLRTRLLELNIRGAMTFVRHNKRAEAITVWLDDAKDLLTAVTELPLQWEGYELRIHAPTQAKPVSLLRVQATTADWAALLNAVYLRDGKKVRELFDSRAFDDDPEKSRLAYFMTDDLGLMNRAEGPFTVINRDKDAGWFEQEKIARTKHERICNEIRDAARKLGAEMVTKGFLKSSRVDVVSYDPVTDVASVVYWNVPEGGGAAVRVLCADSPGRLQSWLEVSGETDELTVLTEDVLSDVPQL